MRSLGASVRSFASSLEARVAFVLAAVLLIAGVVHDERLVLGAPFGAAASACIALAIVILAAIRWKMDAAYRRTRAAIGEESHAQALRMRAILQMATVNVLDPTERFTRMLEFSCSAIRPRRPICASLSHVYDGNVVIDAVAWTGPDAVAPENALVFPGAVISLDDAVHAFIVAAGGSRAWNDIDRESAEKLTFARDAGVKSLIAGTFGLGAHRYFVIYTSPQTMHDAPFTPEDLTFIDIVAELFSNTAKQFTFVDRLQHQTEHDALTGLKNRVHFRKAIRAEIASGNAFGVGIVNLDHFRAVNERHGQMISDEVLVEIAYELTTVDIGNLAARLDGDEFGILVRDVRDADDLAARVDAYLERFEHPFHTGDRHGTRMLAIRASLGCARFPEHGSTSEELVRCANVALDVAKAGGGACAVVFQPPMERILHEREIAVTDIMRALAGDEFRLVYQPTFELATRRIIGAEALLRWDHPERGEVTPGAFIPLAEQTDTIGLVSRWVLGRVARDLGEAPLPEGFRCYFNLAARDLVDFTFVRALTEVVEQHPRLATILGVEITETTAMQNVERSLSTIGIIRGLGVRVAIDDFGTGYSSLSYLKRLSVDLIKIDRAFVRGVSFDERDAALAEAMIDICRRFDAASLAEGIETEEQFAWLAAHGCRYGQGYVVSKPVAFPEFLTRFCAHLGSVS